jgi:hypothetical protein
MVPGKGLELEEFISRDSRVLRNRKSDLLARLPTGRGLPGLRQSPTPGEVNLELDSFVMPPIAAREKAFEILRPLAALMPQRHFPRDA